MSCACLLSIDVDDFAIAACNLISGDDAPASYRSHLTDEVLLTLKLLDRVRIQATFFINAQYCLDNERIIEEIIKGGHIIASHGLKHEDVLRMSLDKFRADVHGSLEILRVYQKKIHGYRPPGFSMPYDDDHLTILKDCGFTYVSAGPSRTECQVVKGQQPVNLSCGLIHVPISCYSFIGDKFLLPIGYGITARFLPERLYLFFLQYWLRHYGFYHFYFHPFEVSGLNGETRAFIQRYFSNHLKLAIFGLRCQERFDYFSRILSHGRFQSIESFLGL
ncbi:MAG: polysaccharide deacetylase family protein [Thermodesulfobacteriota bacterium]